MPESLTDEQILDMQDDAPSLLTEVAEASEPTTVSESTAEESAASEPTLSETSPTTKLETAKKEPVEKAAEQEGSGPLNELFPQGEAQAKEALSKAGELDAMDAALRSGDAAGLAEVVLNTFQQSPDHFPVLLSMGLEVLKQNAPEQYAQLAAYLAGDLKHINSVAQRAPEQAPQVQSATESASWGEFTSAADHALRNFIDADIRRSLGPQFNTVAKQDQEQLLELIHAEVQEQGKSDRGMNLAFMQALRGGLTRESGVAAVNLVASKLRAFVPGIVGRVLQQYPLSQLQQMTSAPARPKVAAKPVASQPTPVAKGEAPLTVSEAWGMSDMDILNSGRVGQRRGTWRPESIFDGV
jgi:hypothetical protein